MSSVMVDLVVKVQERKDKIQYLVHQVILENTQQEMF